jgi:predicted transcriptional regulator
LEGQLKNLAYKLDRSKNYIINQAIKEYAQRQSMEDSRWEDTLEALNSVRTGNSIDSDEVTKWLESWEWCE